MAELVHKDLSYKINGIVFKVQRELGGGYQEKYYQKTIAVELKKNNLEFREQVLVDLQYDGQKIGRYYIDFVIDGKLVLEIKANHIFYNRDIKQVLAYLKASDLLLGILVGFGKYGVKSKRILRGE